MKHEEKRTFERMSFPAMVVNVDEAKGIVDAVVNVFGIIDLGTDIVHKGAFTKTITERLGKIRVLDNHQTNSVVNAVGRPLVIREIGREELMQKAPQIFQQYPDATGGLYTETQYMLDDPTSLAVFKRITNGVINEYSFGFEIMKQQLTEGEYQGRKTVIRNIFEVRMYEYSPVLWGMNPATATVGAKDNTPDKEYTPNGPQQRLGDMLMASVNDAYMTTCNYLLGSGMVSAEEHDQMCGVCDSLMSVMTSGIPEDVRLRPMGGMMPSGAGETDSIDKELTQHEESVIVEDIEQKGDDSAPTTPSAEPPSEAFTEDEDEQIKRHMLELLDLELSLVEALRNGSYQR